MNGCKTIARITYSIQKEAHGQTYTNAKTDNLIHTKRHKSDTKKCTKRETEKEKKDKLKNSWRPTDN